jgi:hypothetical protein
MDLQAIDRSIDHGKDQYLWQQLVQEDGRPWQQISFNSICL